MVGFKIGDGTAPNGFPSYSKYKDGIRCNFNHCGHIGSLGAPSNMKCKGLNCSCPCCRMLAGQIIYGCSYGAIKK